MTLSCRCAFSLSQIASHGNQVLSGDGPMSSAKEDQAKGNAVLYELHAASLPASERCQGLAIGIHERGFQLRNARLTLLPLLLL
jgi:hypothetical protein